MYTVRNASGILLLLFPLLFFPIETLPRTPLSSIKSTGLSRSKHRKSISCCANCYSTWFSSYPFASNRESRARNWSKNTVPFAYIFMRQREYKSLQTFHKVTSEKSGFFFFLFHKISTLDSPISSTCASEDTPRMRFWHKGLYRSSIYIHEQGLNSTIGN